MKSEYKNFTRNRNAIRLAFADLMLKYGDINKITIMEIVKVAQISRGTFYSHYKSIDEVILDIGKEFGEKLKILLEKYNTENYLINSLPYFEELHDFLNKNKELYIKLLQAGQGPVISQYIKTAVYSSMYEMPILRDQYIDQERFKFDLNFFVSGSVQVVLDNLVDSNLQINRDRVVNMVNNKFIDIFVNSRK